MSAAVYYFSGAGHSLATAKHIAGGLGAELYDMESSAPVRSDTAVIIFPVYCQRIPEPVRRFMRDITAGRIAAAATYGNISHGNVLRDAERLLGRRLTAGAYIPTGHTYLREPPRFDSAALSPFLEKLKDENDRTETMIPGGGKDIIAYIFPALRSRIGVKLSRLTGCTSCGICTDICPVGAMRAGIPGMRCIRCLRCVGACPQQALGFSCRPVLTRYLEKRRRDNAVEVFV